MNPGRTMPRIAIPRTSVRRILAPAPLFTGRPWYTTASLVLTDAVALILSVGISVAFKGIFQGGVDIVSYLQLWPFLFVFLMVYAAVGLYSSISIGPPGRTAARHRFLQRFVRLPRGNHGLIAGRASAFHLDPFSRARFKRCAGAADPRMFAATVFAQAVVGIPCGSVRGRKNGRGGSKGDAR